MAGPYFYDRVKESTTFTGTGAISLGGVTTGFTGVGSVLGDGNSAYFCVVHDNADEWEVFLGTHSGGVVARDSVRSSSNSGSLVNFSAGTKHIFITAPAAIAGPTFDNKPRSQTPNAVPYSQDDEFNDDLNMSGPRNGLNAKWSKWNLATSAWIILNDAIAPGCVLFDVASGETAGQAIYETAPDTTSFAFAAKVEIGQSSDRQMWGALILNTSGTGVSIVIDNNVANTASGLISIRTVTTWVNGGVATDLHGVRHDLAPSENVSLTLALRRDGNNYYASLLGDRIISPTYQREVLLTPTSFAPAYVGFGRIFGTGRATVALDFFRRVA